MTTPALTSEVNSEETPAYLAERVSKMPSVLSLTAQQQNAVVAMASEIIETVTEHREALTDPDAVKRYLRMKLHNRECEFFALLVLDNRHRVIAYLEPFRGTIDGAAVYPREVVKEVLQHNGAAVILAHNHPSGIAEPSRADRDITRRLVEALQLIDVRVLDHFVIGQGECTSFAERGWV